MKFNYFSNPLQTLQSAERTVPPLPDPVELKAFGKICMAEKVQIAANERFVIGCNSRSVAVLERSFLDIKVYAVESNIIRLELIDDFICLKLKGKIALFDMQLANLLNIECAMHGVLMHSNFDGIHIISMLLYQNDVLKITDIVIAKSRQFTVTTRCTIKRTVMRPLCCSNGIAVVDDLVYNLEDEQPRMQLQDFRPQYVAGYDKKIGQSLSWEAAARISFEAAGKIIHLQALSNSFCCEVMKNEEQRATFLTFLTSPLLAVHLMHQASRIHVYFIAKQQINYIVLNEDLNISGRICSAEMELLPTEIIKNWYASEADLTVFTTFGRFFSTKSVEPYHELVTACLSTAPLGLQINISKHRAPRIKKQKRQVDDLAFLLQ